MSASCLHRPFVLGGLHSLPLFGQLGKRPVEPVPVPDLPAVDQLGLRHAPVRNHLVEEGDVNGLLASSRRFFRRPRSLSQNARSISSTVTSRRSSLTGSTG